MMTNSKRKRLIVEKYKYDYGTFHLPIGNSRRLCCCPDRVTHIEIRRVLHTCCISKYYISSSNSLLLFPILMKRVYLFAYTFSFLRPTDHRKPHYLQQTRVHFPRSTRLFYQFKAHIVRAFILFLCAWPSKLLFFSLNSCWVCILVFYLPLWLLLWLHFTRHFVPIEKNISGQNLHSLKFVESDMDEID